MMVRKLAAALLGVGVFIPGLANALGLGEIKLNSALSEPLDAEIELVQVRELTSTEILPGLAAQSDFQAAGVERYQILGDLKFEVIIGDKGRSYIKVRSRKPIKEPFLNFLVEVNWPAGRLLREYTLLLDPPIYSEQKAQPVRQAQAAPAPAQRQAAPTQAAPQPSYTPAAEPSYSTTASADSHTISSNDSLWSIAKNLRPSGAVSVQQTMIALQRYNPDAFIDGNINLLRRGQVLRAPTEAQAMEVSSREAIEMVAEQNRLWRERLAARKGSAAPEAQQLDLTGRTADRPAPTARPSDEGRLKLLAGTDGSADSGQGGADGGSGEMRSRLAQAEENIDKFKLENDDLKVKMNDLEDQLKTSEKVLSLKDQQIAALQAKLAELEEQAKAAAAAAPAAVESVPETVAPVTADVEVPEPVAEAPAIEQAPAVEDATVAADAEPVPADVDFNYQEPEVAAEAPAESVEADTSATSAEPGLVMEEEIEPVVQQPAAPEPVPVPQPAPVAPQQDLLSQIMSNPLYLGIAGGAIVLLLAAGLMISRRKKAEEEIGDDLEENFQLPESTADLKDDFDIDLKEPADESLADRDEAPVEQTVPQTADVLGEADIYIAYGRYPQAIEMLENAAAKEPQRADIRMKLCEVCADAKEPETFMKHYRVLQTLGAAALLAKADELRARVAPEADFADSDVAEPEAEVLSDDAESFDFDIADDDATVIAASELEQESDTGLDFDLGDLEDTGASFASQAAEPQADASVPTLDFDLDMDSEIKPADEQPASFVSVEDNSLDFDFDVSTPAESSFDSGSVQSEPVAADTLDFDAEFSLDDADIASSESPASTVAFDEDLSLDFDQMETTPSEPVSDNNSLDFDLDFDVEKPAEPQAFSAEPVSFEAEEDQTIAFTPSQEAAPAAPAEEPELDSASAAQLADELDFDVGLGLDAPGEDATVISAPAFEPEAFTPPPTQPAANDFASSAEDELDFLSDADETSTKLDLARAYIDMGDRDGARDILDEVLIEGSDNQKQEAKDLLARLEG